MKGFRGVGETPSKAKKGDSLPSGQEEVRGSRKMGTGGFLTSGKRRTPRKVGKKMKGAVGGRSEEKLEIISMMEGP